MFVSVLVHTALFAAAFTSTYFVCKYGPAKCAEYIGETLVLGTKLAAQFKLGMADIPIKHPAAMTGIVGMTLIALFLGSLFWFEIPSLSGRVSAVEMQLVQIDGRLNGVDGRLNGVDGRLNHIEQRLGNIEQRFDALNNAVNIRFDVMNNEMSRKFDVLGARMDIQQQSLHQLIILVGLRQVWHEKVPDVFGERNTTHKPETQ